MWDLVFLFFGVTIGIFFGSYYSPNLKKPKSRATKLTLLPPSPHQNDAEGSFSQEPQNKVRRLPTRANYDFKEVHDILDSQVLCHVGLVDKREEKETAVVLPMLYGRKGNKLYLHGHVSSGLHQKLTEGTECCITVTALDALIYAHSLFHSSVNYRSAVCFGTAKRVTNKEKQIKALKVIVENSQPGRWQDARLPNNTEMTSTGVIKVKIHHASAKHRAGPAGDEKEDMEKAENWAGVLPIYQVIGAAETSAHLIPSFPVPSYVTAHPKFYKIK